MLFPTVLAAAASTLLSALLLGVLIAGYLALWAIWHFFFRGR